jgi:5,10-methylenetetrahydromethanopterin reductase
MDFGIALATTVDAWRWVKRAEELGFSHTWFYDTQMLCADPFVAMALAAANTEKIRLGTGVLIPSNRIAPVAANGLASLSKLAPGRIDFGVGTGFTARRTMGLGAMRLDEMREYVRVVRGLLAGDTVESELEGERRKLRFLNPEAGLIDLDSEIPLHISAFGPRGRALSAEIAAGWMTFVNAVPLALHANQLVDSACDEAGRDRKSLYRTGFTLGCVLADGESADGPRARAQAGPLAAVLFHALAEQSLDAPLPPELESAVAAYREIYAGYEPPDARYLELHRGHLMWVREEEQPFLSEDLIRGMTLTGTAPELRDRIRALRDGGYDQLAIQLVPGQEHALDEWAHLLETV